MGKSRSWGMEGFSHPQPGPRMHTHVHNTCTRGWGCACIPALGDEESLVGDPGWEKRGLYPWLLMWVMPRLKNKSQTAPDSCQRLLVVYAKHIG